MAFAAEVPPIVGDPDHRGEGGDRVGAWRAAAERPLRRRFGENDGRARGYLASVRDGEWPVRGVRVVGVDNRPPSHSCPLRGKNKLCLDVATVHRDRDPIDPAIVGG